LSYFSLPPPCTRLRKEGTEKIKGGRDGGREGRKEGETYVAEIAELALIHQRVFRDEGKEDSHFVGSRFPEQGGRDNRRGNGAAAVAKAAAASAAEPGEEAGSQAACEGEEGGREGGRGGRHSG